MAGGHLLLISGLDQDSHLHPGLAPDLSARLFSPWPPEGASEHLSQALSLLFPEPSMAPTSESKA